ncbi:MULTISPECIES: hypothetical protein [unclassified Bradyrhizobium]|uniref:hypothetical protein n=1 Tax=unclassified Bradyrhizobium TaxID=2631580 RepID=UPI003398EF41
MPRQRKLKDATAAERQRRHRERFAAELAELKAAAASARKAPGPGESPVIAVEHARRWPLPTAQWTAQRLGRGAAMVFARCLIAEAEKLPPEPQPAR